MLLEEEERLQDTFLFMFSDHGHRFDPIRQTMIGRLEERMPFFSIHVPQKLRKRYPELADVLNWNSKVRKMLSCNFVISSKFSNSLHSLICT